MQRTRVAVFRGGDQKSYDFSLRTGSSIHSALKQAGYDTKDIVVTPNEEWLVDGLVIDSDKALFDVDVALITMRGTLGESGALQRMLERLGIPYVGSSPFASTLTLNKSMAKDTLSALGVKVPRHVRLTREGTTDIARTTQGITKLFGPNYFVKPERGGLAVDTYLVTSEAELRNVIEKVLDEAPEVLVEERIIGKEATVGVIENYRDEVHYLLPPVEIVPPSSADFNTYVVKYTDASEERYPGRFTRQEKDRLMSIAHKVHTALELRHLSRSDFIIAPDGLYFLEVNALPDIADTSVFTRAADAIGMNHTQLVDHLVSLALQTKR